LFQNFVREALSGFGDLEFVVFAAPGQFLKRESERLRIRGGYAGNDRLVKRLAAEYLQIGPDADSAGCDALITTGLIPLRGKLPKVMQLLTLHHLNPKNKIGGLKSFYRKWATVHGLNKADLVITNTRAACDQILSVCPAVAPRLLQSYEGIDHDLFHPRRDDGEVQLLEERFGIKPGYFFWCSNFYPYKQAELMMEAWCDLPQSVREASPMVMVGGGGWGNSLDNMLAVAERRGAASQVKILGWVTDAEIPVLFRHASVFVHPSREETFGRSVLEAMACGVPTVVHGIPVMREVTAGHSLIVDYNNREEAAAAMLEAHGNVVTRERLIAGGLSRSQDFSFRRLALERIEGIRSALGMKPGAHAEEYPPVFANQF
jgi:glycosyltransferase involved in cell wall biosynthesis